MFSKLLLLFYFIKYSGTSVISVTGKKGETVTLSCESQDREITVIHLYRLSKKLLVCENEECKSENDRVCKEGSCDVIIKDLIYSDAGKYILYVYYNNDQTEVERQIREYHLHIHDEISVKKGEDLKLDVVLINADKVERNSSEGWKKIWRRGHGVSSDRLTDHDGNLTINNFTVTDTGTYRVLDSNNEALITVTVTESVSTGKHKASAHPDREPLSWPEKVNGIWVITIFIAYIVIVAIQIVLRFAGRF